MTRVRLALLATLLAAPAAAHHVGAYVPKDNAVTINFKQVKFSVQARKFDVALRLFETGALRAEMRAHAATLPAGLEDGTRAALAASDGPEVERRLMIFFAALARDLGHRLVRRIHRVHHEEPLVGGLPGLGAERLAGVALAGGLDQLRLELTGQKSRLA